MSFTFGQTHPGIAGTKLPRVASVQSTFVTLYVYGCPQISEIQSYLKLIVKEIIEVIKAVAV